VSITYAFAGLKGFAGHDWIEYNVDQYAMPDAV